MSIKIEFFLEYINYKIIAIENSLKLSILTIKLDSSHKSTKIPSIP